MVIHYLLGSLNWIGTNKSITPVLVLKVKALCAIIHTHFSRVISILQAWWDDSPPEEVLGNSLPVSKFKRHDKNEVSCHKWSLRPLEPGIYMSLMSINHSTQCIGVNEPKRLVFGCLVKPCYRDDMHWNVLVEQVLGFCQYL